MKGKFFAVFLLISSISAYADIISLDTIAEKLDGLNGGKCQVTIKSGTSFVITLLDRSNANEISFGTKGRHFVSSTPVARESYARVTKFARGQKIEMTLAYMQHSLTKNKDYQILVVESDSKNNIRKIVYRETSEVRGLLSLKENVVQSFDCQE